MLFIVICFFALLIVLIAAAALIRIYLLTRNLTWGTIKKELLKNVSFKWWIVCTTLVFVSVFSLFFRMASESEAGAVITLNYAKAYKGQNANATKYNMAEIICDEVLELAIEKGALEHVTAKDLKKCLSVAPLVQGDSFDKNHYHIATEFFVGYKADKNTQHLDADNVITLVANAYKEYYIENYAYNFDVLDINIDSTKDFKDMDYLDIATFLDNRCQQIENYMYGLFDENVGYTASSGLTFYSLAQSCSQLRDVQIEKNLMAYLLQNGISKDAGRYMGRLRYDNTLMDYEIKKAKSSFDIRRDAVEMYAEEMTRIVLVPTWDTDGEYYMGRTKVGIDTLSMEAERSSAQAAEYAKTVDSNESVIAALSLSAGSGINQTAERMIGEISIAIVDLAKTAKNMGQEYSETRMNQCVSASVIEESFFKTALLYTGIAIFFFFSLSLYALSVRLSGGVLGSQSKLSRKESGRI